LKPPGRAGTRTCVGCRKEEGKATMVRIVRRPEGGAVVDRKGVAAGRGAYLHMASACIDLARKKGAIWRLCI